MQFNLSLDLWVVLTSLKLFLYPFLQEREPGLLVVVANRPTITLSSGTVVFRRHALLAGRVRRFCLSPDNGLNGGFLNYFNKAGQRVFTVALLAAEFFCLYDDYAFRRHTPPSQGFQAQIHSIG